ncbi:MAG: histidine phosphatase family protein [Nanoarchaeota archaeon]|nr:histidine phosphatase family protein [Nanoarchaeota archaeon]
MEVIFIRHAETKNNIDGIIQGPDHGDINEKGQKEIEKASELLKNEKIDVFFSSDIPRCKTTSEGINRFHNLPIKYTGMIREKYNGDWTGKNYKEVNWDQLEGTFEARKVNNGESLMDVRVRARKFINELITQYGDTDKKILVVCHGAFLKILIGDLLNMDIKSSIFNLRISHCSPIRVYFNDIVFENRNHKNVSVVSL